MAGREPLIQNTEQRATYFILFSMTVAILNYLRYAKSVIWQMYVPRLHLFRGSCVLIVCVV